MCLTLTLARSDFALLATDRYMYTHVDGEHRGTTDLGRSKLGRVGRSGWATGGGDGRFVLEALQALRDTDPNDLDRVGRAVRKVAARHPDAERSGLELVWWTGSTFGAGTYAADGTFSPARPGAPRFGWPGSPDPAVMDAVSQAFTRDALRALQGDNEARGLAEAVGRLFLAASRVSQWIGAAAEGVLLVPDGAGGCQTLPISTSWEPSHVA